MITLDVLLKMRLGVAQKHTCAGRRALAFQKRGSQERHNNPPEKNVQLFTKYF